MCVRLGRPERSFVKENIRDEEKAAAHVWPADSVRDETHPCIYLFMQIAMFKQCALLYFVMHTRGLPSLLITATSLCV